MRIVDKHRNAGDSEAGTWYSKAEHGATAGMKKQT